MRGEIADTSRMVREKKWVMLVFVEMKQKEGAGAADAGRKKE